MVAATEPSARDPKAMNGRPPEQRSRGGVVLLQVGTGDQPHAPLPVVYSLLNNAHVVVLFFCRLSCVVVSTSLRLEFRIINNNNNK